MWKSEISYKIRDVKTDHLKPSPNFTNDDLKQIIRKISKRKWTIYLQRWEEKLSERNIKLKGFVIIQKVITFKKIILSHQIDRILEGRFFQGIEINIIFVKLVQISTD